MKKLRVNKKYGIWFYIKIEEEFEEPFYEFWNEEKTEHYYVGSYRQILECVKEETKELREKYLIMYS